MHGAEICVHAHGSLTALAGSAATKPPASRSSATCPCSTPPWDRLLATLGQVHTDSLFLLSPSRALFLLPSVSFLTLSSPLSSWNSYANILGSKWSPEQERQDSALPQGGERAGHH